MAWYSSPSSQTVLQEGSVLTHTHTHSILRGMSPEVTGQSQGKKRGA